MTPSPSTVRVWGRSAQHRRERGQHAPASLGVLLISSIVGLGLALLAAVLSRAG